MAILQSVNSLPVAETTQWLSQPLALLPCFFFGPYLSSPSSTSPISSPYLLFYLPSSITISIAIVQHLPTSLHILGAPRPRGKIYIAPLGRYEMCPWCPRMELTTPEKGRLRRKSKLLPLVWKNPRDPVAAWSDLFHTLSCSPWSSSRSSFCSSTMPSPCPLQGLCSCCLRLGCFLPQSSPGCFVCITWQQKLPCAAWLFSWGHLPEIISPIMEYPQRPWAHFFLWKSFVPLGSLLVGMLWNCILRLGRDRVGGYELEV